MVKIISRFFLGLCILALFIIFVEGLYFAWILNLENLEAQSDAIIIFRGTQKRIETGYDLANQGLATRIVLSPATDKQRQSCDRKYALKNTVVHIIEDQANTTFQNALYISRIIKDQQLKTVTLVTSDYHMPRSLAMLRLLLAGKDIRVQSYKVDGRNQAEDIFAYNVTLMKLIYNEMVETL